MRYAVDDIKQKYRTLQRLYHPDISGKEVRRIYPTQFHATASNGSNAAFFSVRTSYDAQISGIIALQSCTIEKGEIRKVIL
jgi:hypothetical protein